MLFENRIDAGQKLAAALTAYMRLPKHLVIGLPRGGVIVAKQIATALHLPLDIVVARKIGAPFNPELAVGALAGDQIFLNEALIHSMGINKEDLEQIIAAEKREAERRESLYRKGRSLCVFQDHTILLIDDGLATGATVQAAIEFLKEKKARAIVLAVPVSHPETLQRLGSQVDRIVCLATPTDFFAVGQFYSDFTPVLDEEVCSALKSL